MSLVNELLKELELRKSPSELLNNLADDQSEDYLEDYIAYEPFTESKSQVKLVFTLCVLLIGLVGIGFWIKDGNSAVESGYASVSSHSSAIAKPYFANANANAPANLHPLPESVVTQQLLEPTKNHTIIDNAPLSSSESRVEKLLADAAEALSNNQLTEPLEDNALSRYQSILLVDPSHEQALAGIRAIVNRYIQFANTRHEQGDLKGEEIYLVKAKKVAVNYPAINRWLLNIVPKEQDPIAVVANSKSKRSQEISKSTEGSQLSVRPSQQAQDRKHSRQVDILIQQNRIVEARDYLQQVLEDSPELKLCQEKMFEVYLLQKQRSLAEKQLEKIGHLDKFQSAYLAAKLEVTFNQWAVAADVLESYNPDVQYKPHYYALLGAVYNRLSRHSDSVLVYKKLLSVDKQQSAYWLGLATSHDAMGNRPEALKAFRFSRLYGGLDTNTYSYVEKRISELNRVARAG